MSDLIIRVIEDKQDELLTPLWIAAFPNDPVDYVVSFLSDLPQDTVTMVGECNGEPVTMLFLLPAVARFRGVAYPARYLYAGCTHPDHRGHGYYRRLMSAAAEKVAELNENAIYLHPADDALTATYQRLGYKKGICRYKPQIGVELPPICPSVDTYMQLRNSLINRLSLERVYWDTCEQISRFFIADAVSRKAQIRGNESGVAIMCENAVVESLGSNHLKNDDAFCLWLPINGSSVTDLMNKFGGSTGLVGD